MPSKKLYSDVRENPRVPVTDSGRFTVRIAVHRYHEDRLAYPNGGCVDCGFREYAGHHVGEPIYDIRAGIGRASRDRY